MKRIVIFILIVISMLVVTLASLNIVTKATSIKNDSTSDNECTLSAVSEYKESLRSSGIDIDGYIVNDPEDWEVAHNGLEKQLLSCRSDNRP